LESRKNGAGWYKDEIAELRKQVALLEARVYTLERRLDKMTQPRMIPIQR
jgi:ubiquinone biosynthesis protein UbiJ